MTDTRSSEEFDRLRAGLNDGQPAQREQMRAVGRDTDGVPCGDPWGSLLTEMDALANSSAAVNNQLRLRRRQVLSGRYRRRSTWLPRVALAACAGIALIMAVTHIRQPTGPGAVTSTASSADDWREVPDLADNVDFYHWMEKRAIVATDHKGT